MSIGAYDPWIRVHANPEQVIAMCDATGVRYIMPVHHQTFRLSVEPFREPIKRFEAALQKSRADCLARDRRDFCSAGLAGHTWFALARAPSGCHLGARQNRRCSSVVEQRFRKP